jgi:hypothetical protein
MQKMFLNKNKDRIEFEESKFHRIFSLKLIHQNHRKSLF